MHTLKGAARSVGLVQIEELCRACEAVLSLVTHGTLGLSPALVACLLEAVDRVGLTLRGEESPSRVRELVERLELAAAGRGETRLEAPDASAPATEAAPQSLQAETIRLSTAKLDSVLVEAEDLLIPKLAAAERTADASALAGALAHCRQALARATAGDASLRDEIEPELRAAESLARDLLAHLVRDQRRLASSVDSLQTELRRMRMRPAAAVLESFPMMVRNLADEQGKKVDWSVRGAGLEIDRRILETIKDPLIHLVRNAVAHGIEDPEARVAAGKPPRGRVSISFSPLEGERIEVAVEDDGTGADPRRIREAAVRAGLVTSEDAEALGDDETLDLVFRSGLSTSPIITDLSGHGLGLAIVEERVGRLEGEVRLENRPGAGMTVRLVLPASIATFRGLLVRAGGQPFLLPVEAVERVLRTDSGDIRIVDGREAIRWNGDVVPVGRSERLLDLPEPVENGNADKRPAVIVRAGTDRIALLVDEVAGDRELLLKELQPPLGRVPNIAAAGLLGTGEVVLILRAADLVRGVREHPHRPPPSAPPSEQVAPAILVVDDSITTRTMEKNLLEAAGYSVEMAVDGLEGWTALRSRSFDVVVSDVDMPRLDGFELTRRIREDRDLAELPVVLVTALESRDDRERGIEVGADAYLVKSSFDQSNLLEIVQRLTARPRASAP
jgi:two-component system chemotaxis sensor kinase CheA